jgi:hypothetical protein
VGKWLAHWAPILLTTGGLFILVVFGGLVLGTRLALHLDGVIISRVDVIGNGVRGSPAHSARYTIRWKDGHETELTVATGDTSIGMDFPVSTVLLKRRWELGYEADGKWIAFPLQRYLVALGCAAVAAVGGSYWLLRRRAAKA